MSIFFLKKYEKYLIRMLSTHFFIALLVALSITWLLRSMKFIELIINKGASFFSFIYISAALLPSMILIIIPICLVVAVLHLLKKLQNDRELIIFRASGMSSKQISRPFVKFALAVTLFNYLIAIVIMPLSYREFKEEMQEIKKNIASVLFEEGVFNYPINGLTIYYDDVSHDGMLTNMMIYDGRNGQKSVIFADKAKIIATNAGFRINLYDGMRQELDENEKLMVLSFTTFAADYNKINEVISIRDEEVEEKFINQMLFEQKNIFNDSKTRSELSHRLIWPLYSIILLNFAIGIIMNSEFQRKNNFKSQVKGAVMVVGVSVFYFIGNSLSSKNLIIFVIFLTISLILLAVSFKILDKK